MTALSRNYAAPAALVLGANYVALSRNYGRSCGARLKALQCSAEGADRR
jgi:hypothetical protein